MAGSPLILAAPVPGKKCPQGKSTLIRVNLSSPGDLKKKSKTTTELHCTPHEESVTDYYKRKLITFLVRASA